MSEQIPSSRTGASVIQALTAALPEFANVHLRNPEEETAATELHEDSHYAHANSRRAAGRLQLRSVWGS
jgi:hypothetical protein